MKRQVYLLPGFFGFSSLGDVNYFYKVAEELRGSLDRLGAPAEVIDCSTKPTASIRRRAEAVIDEVVQAGGLDADELHFVGHSTGGLDARLLLSPGVRLRQGDIERRIADKTKSCITLATPHFGTPLAGFFTTLPGRHLLEVLTVLADTTPGRNSVYWGARALRAATRIDDIFGLNQTFLDVWSKRIVGRITRDASDPIFEFIRDVSEDQGAIIQLTPESMNLFNAAVVDHESIDYASIASAAPPQPTGYSVRDVLKPSVGASRVAFGVLYTLASRQHRHYPYPYPGDSTLREASEGAPFPLDAGTNDGVVPTFSQLYGRLLGLSVADHLDVVGQYDTGEPFSDWLPCGAGYDSTAFTQTWRWAAEHISQSAK